MKNKNFFPPKEQIEDIAELIKDLLVKNGTESKHANDIKKSLVSFFVDNCGAWGLGCEETILRQIEGLNDAFFESPKQFKKQVMEMVATEREEREKLFNTSSNGEELRKAFDSFEF